MCGFFSIHKKKDTINNLEKSADLVKNNLKRRGPDSQVSLFLDDSLIKNSNLNYIKNLIIASRLNIIDDNNKSNLPFISNCKNYILSFNGEIYNFKELKTKYLKNIQHTTESDTEVLLNLLILRGERILNELNGIFSICFYDLINKKILLAKDRLGIKPLFYYYTKETLLFSSDVKNILSFKEYKKKINKNLSVLFLNNISSIKKDETFFEGIKKIDGGKYMIFDLKNFIFEKNKNYWYLEKNTDSKIFKSTDLFDDLHSTVQKQGVTRTFACTLSGGLDSSIIAFLLRKIYPDREINAYSFTFSQNQNINEKQYSDLMSHKLNLKKKEIKIENHEILESLKTTNLALSFPAYGFSNVAQNLVYEKINKDGIRVCYDGQGADEIFGGYHGFGSSLMYSNLKKLDFVSLYKNLLASFENQNMKSRFYINFLSRFLNPNLFKFFLRFTDKSEIKNSLNYDQKDYDQYLSSYLSEKKIVKNNDFKNEILYFLTKGIGPLLSSLDANSMHFSIEARVPFLDNFILDKYISMDNNQRISNSLIFKKLLKDAFKDKIPKQVLNRNDKVGFSTDDELLLRANIDEIISEVNSLQANSIIDKKNFLKVLNEFKKNKIKKTPNIFKMYSYYLWCNQFGVYE